MNKKTGFFTLFSTTTASLMLSACSSVPPLYVEQESNNSYYEKNFYGRVVDVHIPKTKEKVNKDIKQEIMISGERGTLVRVQTEKEFHLNDQVLFKVNDKNHAQVILVSETENNPYQLKQNPVQYKDISPVQDNNLYQDTDHLRNVKKYKVN